MFSAKITGTGLYHPETLITNEELGNILGSPLKSSVETKIGIRQRYVTGPNQSTADMATFAANKAIEDAGISKEDVELCVVATDTPEYITPPTSCVVQGRVGCFNAGCFDINGSCSGFVAALNAASRMVMTGGYKHALVIGVYNMTKFVDREAMPALAPIFADGAGAVIVSRTEEPGGFVDSKLIADGTQYDLMGIYVGGAKYPATEELCREGKAKLLSLKPLPGDRNIKLWPPIVQEIAAKNGLKVSDIDHFVFTQINKWVIEEVMKILEQPMEKTTCIMGDYGYTGSACIPMALDVALKNGNIKKGDKVLLLASGVGFAVAATLFQF
jgi:3-oxoacyl-[acyl-carrier-protein] synthase-3